MKYSEVKEVNQVMNRELIKSGYGVASKLEIKECLIWISAVCELDMMLDSIPYDIEELVLEYIELNYEFDKQDDSTSQDLENIGYSTSLSHIGLSIKDFI